LTYTNRVVASDQANWQWGNRNGFTTNTEAATGIGHCNGIGSAGIYVDTTRSLARTPQVAGTSTGTQLGGSTCTISSSNRYCTNGQWADSDDFAASTNAATYTSHDNRISSGSIDIDATGTCASAPQIAGTATGTKLGRLAYTYRVIAYNRTNG
jgi:hypothetical protein